MTNSFEIGQRFTHHYQANQFQILPRGSLLDPLVPMTFVGSVGLSKVEAAVQRGEDRSGERYVTVQPCFRHFDIEKVAKSQIHLSMFQMAGAFVFGQVSRADALGKIWRFFTTELKLSPRNLWVTYFAGGRVDDHMFARDEATATAWRKLGLPDPQVVPMGGDVSFWRQSGGLSGVERYRKCGPTTEVYFDRGNKFSCGAGCRPGCRCGRFTEIANILFIHSQIDTDSRRVLPLVTPFDETVCGLERLAMVLSDCSSVFQLDDFKPVLNFTRDRAGDRSTQHEGSMAIITEHLRALLFLVADGAPAPGRGGRRRIIRTLIRRVITQQKILGLDHPDFLAACLAQTATIYQHAYPHINDSQQKLLGYFEVERERFEQTLASGFRRLDRLVNGNGGKILSGDQAVDLIKNYGFPFALLQTVLARRSILLDQQDYRRAFWRWRQQLGNART